MKYTVLIADDHPIFMTGIKMVIKNNIPEADLVGEAANGIDAYNLIMAVKPDIAILDYEMPTLKGVDVCKRALAENSATRFIIITGHNEKQFFNEAMDSGIKGYLLKNHLVDELVKCMRCVGAGRQYVDPEIGNFLVDYQLKKNFPANIGELYSSLTPTEKVIIKMISESKSSSDIAGQMFISEHTVENHRANISRKLNLKGKNSVLKFAIQYSEML